ncbi:MAG TPA: hypothetical protein VFR58_06120 [Flavisolibacter sp.]|nr:hypothetical protein [Flavisolibacter sp.]
MNIKIDIRRLPPAWTADKLIDALLLTWVTTDWGPLSLLLFVALICLLRYRKNLHRQKTKGIGKDKTEIDHPTI